MCVLIAPVAKWRRRHLGILFPWLLKLRILFGQRHCHPINGGSFTYIIFRNSMSRMRDAEEQPPIRSDGRCRIVIDSGRRKRGTQSGGMECRTRRMGTAPNRGQALNGVKRTFFGWSRDAGQSDGRPALAKLPGLPSKFKRRRQGKMAACWEISFIVAASVHQLVPVAA